MFDVFNCQVPSLIYKLSKEEQHWVPNTDFEKVAELNQKARTTIHVCARLLCDDLEMILKRSKITCWGRERSVLYWGNEELEIKISKLSCNVARDVGPNELHPKNKFKHQLNYNWKF